MIGYLDLDPIKDLLGQDLEKEDLNLIPTRGLDLSLIINISHALSGYINLTLSPATLQALVVIVLTIAVTAIFTAGAKNHKHESNKHKHHKCSASRDWWCY